MLKIVKKEQIQRQEQIANEYTVYLDMDGVLSNFDLEVDRDPTYQAARKEMLGVLNAVPELAKLTDDELARRLSGEQREPSLKALKKAFNKYRATQYGVAGKEGFFLNLPEMPGARQLIKGIAAINGGKLPNILTAPLSDNSEACAKEKHAWMNKHFPGMFNEFICENKKYLYAQGNPNNILIDDRTKNTRLFEQAGGTAILHTEGTGAEHTLNKLRKIVNNNNSTSLIKELIKEMIDNTINKPKKNVSYTALVVSREDHRKLLGAFPMPEGWEPIAHHVTLNMGAWKGPQELLGQEFTIDVKDIAQDNLVAAASVSLPPTIQTANKVPHITLGVNRAAGGKPVMSNNLDWSSATPLVDSVTVVGKLIEVSQGDNPSRFSDEY